MSRQEKPTRRAVCSGCGYPLRGLVSGRCPECGRRFPPFDVRPDDTRGGLVDGRFVIAAIVGLTVAVISGIVLLGSFL